MPEETSTELPASRPVPPQRRAGAVAAVFVVVFLLAQVAVPVAVLFRTRGESGSSGLVASDIEPESRRFGWHMFAIVRRDTTARALLADGTSTVIDPVDALGSLRGRMLYDGRVLAELCDQDDRIVEVRWDDLTSTCP